VYTNCTVKKNKKHLLLTVFKCFYELVIANCVYTITLSKSFVNTFFENNFHNGCSVTISSIYKYTFVDI
jgi:hypothetical protein